MAEYRVAKALKAVRAKAPTVNRLTQSVFDLCLFSSWGRQTHELQLHNGTRTIYELWENIKSSWASYPPEKL